MSPEDIMKEVSSLTPIYGGISWKRLDSGELLRWPCLDDKHAGTRFLHKDRFTRGKGAFHPVEYREPAEVPDGDYPFLLTTGRTIFHYHTGTMTRRTGLLAGEAPTGFIEMNSKDASRLGVKEGDAVSVESRRGTIRIRVRVTDGIAEGVVFIPFHFIECAANVLTSCALDPLAKIPELKVCAVRIGKGGTAEPAPTIAGAVRGGGGI
jgi:predicted molibdopterin-dependent oxidoreductase YjgC